ncbi:MAG: D-aminoacyl-tRNA deacylase [Nitriliruptor sp.]
MRAVVQRVSSAAVTSTPAEGGPATETGRIERGLVVLVGATHDDDVAAARKLAEKVWHLRVFADEEKAMNRSCAEVGGGVLVVSQFTVYGDTRKGRRPSFVASARPEHAEPLIDAVVDRLRELGAEVATGVFRTHMEVSLVGDGPVIAGRGLSRSARRTGRGLKTPSTVVDVTGVESRSRVSAAVRPLPPRHRSHRGERRPVPPAPRRGRRVRPAPQGRRTRLRAHRR